ncbi:hypothetical protein IJ556_07535 [bacterium]|nr:hypothetical protein [bacterium]
MQYRRVYIIECENRKTGDKRVSQEGYYDLDDAQRYCESRPETDQSSDPKFAKGFRYVSLDYYYTIHEVIIR